MRVCFYGFRAAYIAYFFGGAFLHSFEQRTRCSSKRAARRNSPD
jgi:hypothetical protein